MSSEGEGAVKSAISKIKKVKHIEIIIAVVAVLVMLAIYFSGVLGGGSKAEASNKQTAAASNYCTFLQSELEDLISNLSGAGKAKVLINWESSIELILAETNSSSSGNSSSSPIIIQGSNGSSPVILKEIYPKAVGVLIICQGGNDPKIKINVVMAVSSLLDISPDKVMVYAMTK